MYSKIMHSTVFGLGEREREGERGGRERERRKRKGGGGGERMTDRKLPTERLTQRFHATLNYIPMKCRAVQYSVF